MENYTSYMDKQELSAKVHEKLLNLEVPKKRPRSLWVRYSALAACAALILGVGAWRLAPGPAKAPAQSEYQFAADYAPKHKEEDTVGPEDLLPGPAPAASIQDDIQHSEASKGTEDSVSRAYPGDSFVVNSPVQGDETIAFYCMPYINYQDVTNKPSVSPDWCWAKGTFKVFLGMEDIQKLFWGPEGVPETYQTEIGRQDLPWALFWDGYTLRAHAWYSPEGKLREVYLFGVKGDSFFELRMDPGQLPITCVYDPDRESTEAFGVEVTGWSKVYDWNGDGETDYICGSEFMTKNEIGVRFESWNNGNPEDGIDGEAWFNTLFVRQALSGGDGLHLDHLRTTDDIPDDPDTTW